MGICTAAGEEPGGGRAIGLGRGRERGRGGKGRRRLREESIKVAMRRSGRNGEGLSLAGSPLTEPVFKRVQGGKSDDEAGAHLARGCSRR